MGKATVEAPAPATRPFRPDELPSGSDWEQGLSIAMLAYERGGMEGVHAALESAPGYTAGRCETERDAQPPQSPAQEAASVSAEHAG